VKIAAIDIGSNSIHMVVARIDAAGHFTPIDRAKESVRLGQGTLRTHTLSARARRAGLETLRTFRRLAETHEVERILAVATSAVREARNGGDFLADVGRKLRIHVDVITGTEEARLIHLAVSNALDLGTEPVLIVDVGGGSVEFIVAKGPETELLESRKIGVLRLADRWKAKDPPTSAQVRELEKIISEEIDDLCSRIRSRRPRRMIGTSGTALNLAAVAAHLAAGQPPARLNALRVKAAAIQRARDLIIHRDRKRRQRIPGLERRRVDIIVPGAILISQVMREVGARELTVCDWAVREGIILDFIRRHGRDIADSDETADVRRRAVLHLGRRFDYEAAHAQQVARLAGLLFDQTRALHGLGARERTWLEEAALLHDLGNHVAHTSHHRHTYYLIRNGELMGIEPDEIALIAAVARYHRKGGPKEKDEEMQELPERLRPYVEPLAALLRLADGLDRSHFGVVRDLKVTQRGSTVTIRVAVDGRAAAELELWAARRKADVFEKVFNKRIRIAIGA
jgi:exopolyphosphatase/guanosine-5'-triphosphate,3'-diphosphate pyrophosphatase